jgi:putative ABC transport system permease protein
MTPIVKTELLHHSNISAASVSSMSVVGWSSSFGIDWPGKRADHAFDVGYNRVDYDFIETFGLEMRAGRFFSREFATDEHDGCVVNQALVRAMGVTDPVGMEITIAVDSSFESRATIIGVIQDFNTESAHRRVRPYLMQLTTTGSHLWLRVSGHELGQTLSFIRTTVKELAPDSQVSCRLLNDDLGNLYTIERLTGLVIALITSLAVFISCLGLLGLTAFTAEQRTKEIGIRKVLGAEVRDILKLLMREVVILVSIAGAIACPISYLVMSRWLETFAFRTTVSPDVLATAVIAVFVLALLTVLRQARRAALVNPIDAIRYE